MKNNNLVNSLNDTALNLFNICKQNNVVMTCAESCTGGMISMVITSIAGSSAIYDRGYIVYSYQSKHDILDIDMDLIIVNGAVSDVIAFQMADAARKKCPQANASIAVTGIAGPAGGTDAKPIGLVYISATYKDYIETKKFVFNGSREMVRLQSSINAMQMLIDLIKDNQREDGK